MKGLYLITNDDQFDLLLQKVQIVFDHAAVALFQYRRKSIDTDLQLFEIEQLLTLAQKYQVPFIINDNLTQAQQFGCGVHLGQGDGSLLEARARLGVDAIIGRTCHASLELAQQAAEQGASYLAFGAVNPSSTKPNAQRVELSTLCQAREQFTLPICAIGGLTAENSLAVKQVGVDLFAVVGDVLGLPLEHVGSRAKAWAQLLSI